MSFYLLEINHVAPITTCSTEPSEQTSLTDEWHNDLTTLTIIKVRHEYFKE